LTRWRARPWPRLAPLSASAKAALIQQRLADLGHAPGAVDGQEGPRTRAALQRWQVEAGLSATGHRDPATDARLFA
jgi:peptidoglycan hydrolase-like protein with peptidoglycan-binding domain